MRAPLRVWDELGGMGGERDKTELEDGEPALEAERLLGPAELP